MSEALLDHATETIRVGSKSFAAAAKLFDRDTRRSVLMLYAWCRHCDDVVDGQALGHNTTAPADAAAQVERLRNQTLSAYAGEPQSAPAFAAFQDVALRHAISPHHAFDHLAGFAMDAADARYETIDDTLRYCYHVAGVVGLMMASIMGARDAAVLDRACDLGLAFQLTNIARDEKPAAPRPVILRPVGPPPSSSANARMDSPIRPRNPRVAVSETTAQPWARAASSASPSMTVLPMPRAPVKMVSRPGAPERIRRP